MYGWIIYILPRSRSEISEVSEKSLCARTTAAIVSFSYINVSQGSVVTQFRCSEISNNHSTENYQQSVTVKEFLNRSIFGEDIGKSMLACFFLIYSRCTSHFTTYCTYSPVFTLARHFSCRFRRRKCSLEESSTGDLMS